jgi:hypothetical protein
MTRPNPKIYGYYERLVPIEVMGRTFEVPEGIPLIRAFQFIQFELGAMQSDWSLFCFNDTIGCCNFGLTSPEGQVSVQRACCIRVYEGLVVESLPEGSVLIDPSDEPADE